MHPILFSIGPLHVRAYGVFVAIAFLAALTVARKAARLRQIPDAFMVDLGVLLILTGLLGARAVYVILNAGYYATHWVEILKVWEGGLVFYGGFLAAAGAGVLFARRRGVDPSLLADVLAPALALGQSLGRWGCFFAGCCYGKPTTRPWGVTFSNPEALAPLGTTVHPTQIYEALGCLIIAFVLWRRFIQKPSPPGQVFWLYVALYAVLRFALEFLRGDDRGPFWGALSPSQIVAVAAFILAIGILLAYTAAPGPSHARNPHDRRRG